MLNYRFNTCRMEVSGERPWLQTIFSDHSRFFCYADHKSEFAKMALSFGYQNDFFGCCFDNQIFHIIVSELWGLDYSPHLWVEAHQQSKIHFPKGGFIPQPQQCIAEQNLVCDLQIYFKKGEPITADIRQLASAAGLQPGSLQKEFRDRIKEAARRAREQRCQ